VCPPSSSTQPALPCLALTCPACSATLGGGLFIISVIFSLVVLVPKAGEDSGEPAEITVRRLAGWLAGWLAVGRLPGCLPASLTSLSVHSWPACCCG
jgi:hypothetical protein